MNINIPPNKQTKLLGLDKTFDFCKNLFENKKLPNKILFSGQKGIGKATLCYHLSNYILSKDELDAYNIENKEINSNNKTYNLIINNIHPNDIAMVLDQYNIAIRTGHHCAQPLMKKLKINSSARISLGIYNDKKDIDSFIEGINETKKFFK